MRKPKGDLQPAEKTHVLLKHRKVYMRIKPLLIISVMALTLNAFAQQRTYWGERFRYDREGATLFFPNEFQVDLFGTYADRDRFGNPVDNFGGGIGLNYFLTRYVGVMADTYIEEWKLPYRVNGSLVLRLPIDQIGVAPYIFGGGGRQYKYFPQWTAHAGGGLEIRLNPNTGLFADGRRVWADITEDTALVRFGLRVGF
jgi:hypothetical protein